MDKKKKNILIGGLLAVVLLLAVGYAAFATTLTINGTSSIDSRWDVHIKDNGVSVKSSNMATNVNAQKDSQLTASFECELTDPGVSTISYDIIVENTGTFGAKLSSISLTGATTYIDATYEGMAVGDVIAANGEDTLTVTVSYKDVSSVPTGSDLRANITVTLNYVQDDGSSPAPSSLIIDPTFVPDYYAYHTDEVWTDDVVDTSMYPDAEYIADTSTWTQDPSSLGRNYYLGHDVEGGKVTANYACFILNNTQYCLKSSSDGSTWADNKALLETLKNAGTITCTEFSESYATCSGGSLGNLRANSFGIASAGVSTSVFCGADNNGISACGE